MKILDVWFPVDCTHGSGDKPDPFYFAIPPEQLIYTHMPQSDAWQLLEHPLPLEAFKCRIAPSNYYFKYGRLLSYLLTAVFRVVTVILEYLDHITSLFRGAQPLFVTKVWEL